MELREFEKLIEYLYYYDRLIKIFEEIDTDDDHRVTFSEFKQGIDLLGEDHADDATLKKQFNSIDKNRGGYILFDEVSVDDASRSNQ